jgi:hypothetical protein
VMSSLTEGLVVMADPNFEVHEFKRVVRNALLRNRAEKSIARDAEIDDLVELMDGYAV